MLVEKGADVNAQRGRFGNALQAASQRGHEKVVQLLMEKERGCEYSRWILCQCAAGGIRREGSVTAYRKGRRF